MKNRNKGSIKERLLRNSIPVPESGCWLWEGQLSKPHGYPLVHLPDGGHGYMARAHRVSYETFKGQIPKDMHVCHSCDTIGTNADNMRDRFVKGRYVGLKGADNPRAKLSDEIVREIRESKEGKTLTARRYGVARSLIGRIRNRTAWGHIQ